MVATPRERRFSSAIIIATLILCAFFLAQGTTSVLAAELLATDAAAAPPRSLPARGAVAPWVDRKHDAAIILRRNIFDSERGDLTAEPRPEVVLGPDGEPVDEWDPNRPPPKCNSNLRLVGTVVSPASPDWSFAAIAGTSDGKTMLYREGNEADGARILAVYASRVVMSSGGGACQLFMFEEELASQTPVPTPVAAPARTIDHRNAGLTDEELEDGIEKISDNKFIIQRSLVDKVLANQGSIMRAARVIPHEEDGRVVGVRLYGIRRTSLLGRLGVRNGDMLRTINGYDMSSPDSALEAYTRLRTSDRLTLALKRQNNDMTIEYTIE